jgi:hypothetical protein
MNCKQVQNKLIFFIEGDLNNTDSASFKIHIDGCSECQYLFNQIKSSLEFIERDNAIDVNPYFSTRVLAALENKKNQTSVLNLFRIKKYSLRLAFYSFLFFVAFFIGRFLGMDKIMIEQNSISQKTEISDNELFAESYQLQLNNEDVYIINTEESNE